MNTNKENPLVGKKFQDLAAELLARYYDIEFTHEETFDIGSPPKPHKFDLVSKDRSIVAECKCYTWTKGHNSPSAKIATLNEAVLYFKLLHHQCKKLLLINKSKNPKTGESLALYYLRRYIFVLEGITVIELDTESQTLKTIKN